MTTLIRKIKNYTKHLPTALLVTLYHRYPARHLRIILVSGTDGKTTTTNFIYHLLNQAGLPVGMISTIEVRWGQHQQPTGLHTTNPSSYQLNKWMSMMVKDNIKYLVLEVTSHGIDQFRNFGIKPDVYVLTNITHEHLDYHLTFDHYLKTKLKPVSYSHQVVYNSLDDNLYQALKDNPKAIPTAIGRTNRPANLLIRLIRRDYRHSRKSLIKITSQDPKLEIKTLTPFQQPYNLTNLALAVQTALLVGVSPEVIQKAISNLPVLKGRLNQVDTSGMNFDIYIDFAHTPNALDQVLKYLKSIKPKEGRLIAVFGSAGLRDKLKRPMLVTTAAQHADTIVLTAEDPRTEPVEEIINQMTQGFPPNWRLAEADNPPKSLKKKYFIIPDRKKAIQTTITQLAGEHDIIGFFGKGHEASICYGTTELPWDEEKEVKKALLKRLTHNYIAGIVLAAGKSTRLASVTKNKINKAMIPVLGRPMIDWAKQLLDQAGLSQQIYVIGFRQQAIRRHLGPDYTYVVQKKLLGTGDAVKQAVKQLDNRTRHMVVLSVDQAFYPAQVLTNFIDFYINGGFDAAVLSVIKDNPHGLGRIVRNSAGNLTAIIEETEASPQIKKIKEINTGTYIFSRQFIDQFIDKLPLRAHKNEYYLTDIFNIALKTSPHQVKVGVLQVNNPLVSLGFNTPEQLQQGEQIIKKFQIQR